MGKLSKKALAKRRKTWAEARKRAHRRRYSSDPEYRERERAAALDRMRRKHGVSSTFKDPRENLPILSAFGDVRKVEWDGNDYLTFTVAELADMLGQSRGTVYRWIENGQLPAPVVDCEVETGVFGRAGATTMMDVYLEDEVRAILDALGPHLASMHYYRQDHTDVIEKVFAGVDHVRKEYGICLRK